MSYTLVLIKNGEDLYSPIIYDENDGLSIDDSIRITCTSWMKPKDCNIELENDVKYLININDRYGYINNNIETYFSKFLSKYILKELKDVSFKHSIYSAYY